MNLDASFLFEWLIIDFESKMLRRKLQIFYSPEIIGTYTPLGEGDVESKYILLILPLQLSRKYLLENTIGISKKAFDSIYTPL